MFTNGQFIYGTNMFGDPIFSGRMTPALWRNIQGLKDISLVLTLVIVNVSLFDGGKD
jgi:hypothetical protein